jgi:ubiquinone/menaquinone biosynthesis C-methylase UbiE
MDDFIKTFWNKQANTYKSSPNASWKDVFAIELEQEQLTKLISKSGKYILDVGCANGFAIFKQALIHKDKNFTGIDFAQDMINHAKNEWSKLDEGAKNRIAFECADIRKLPYPDSKFDFTLTTRTLINLPNWTDQQKAILELARVTKKGGLIALSEAFYEPLVNLNAIRIIAGLEPLVEHDFNRYLKYRKLVSFLNDQGFRHSTIEFTSTYYFGTRILRELVTQDNSYESNFNRYFFELAREFEGGNFGIQKLFLIER